MRIVFGGTPEVAVPGLAALIESGHEIVGVITREDAPVGRKRVLTQSPVAEYAQKIGLPVFKANRLGDDALEWVKNLDAQLGVVIAYGGLLKSDMLEAPEHGWINLHFSTLPKWRGAAPVQRALMQGETDIGVTVFRLVEALDAGAIVSNDEHYFPQGTSAGEVLTELSVLGSQTLLRAVAEISNDPEAGRQQEGDSSYAHKLSREDGKLNLAEPADVVLATWAGVTPEPGAWALCGDESLKILELSRSETAQNPDIAPGTVTILGGKAILQLHGANLQIDRVQPAGKQAMDAAAWLRGKNGSVTLS